MIKVNCVKRFKDNNGRIYGYRLQDIYGNTRDFKPEDLKDEIRNGRLSVVNLTLTSDNRLIACEIQESSLSSYSNKKLYEPFSNGVYDVEKIDDTKCRIVLYKGNNVKTLTIPKDINGLAVVEVGRQAFAGHTEIEKVILPDCLMLINIEAFANCRGLKSIDIPKSVERIAENAFIGCAILASAVIGNDNTILGNGAFKGCSSVVLTYRGCKIVANKPNTGNNGILSSKDKVTSDGFEIETNSKGEVVLKSGKNAKEIIKIPDGVQIIDERAFMDNQNITGVIMPDSITIIHGAAFCNCRNLQNVVLSNKLKVMHDRAFGECSKLKSITLPSSVEVLEWGVFEGCNSLESISLPSSIKYIGPFVFNSCSKLANVEIPVKENLVIHSGTFDGTPWMTSKLSKENFFIHNNTLIDVNTEKCNGILKIPDGVVAIGHACLSRMLMSGEQLGGDRGNMTGIEIPSSVEVINNYAFAGSELQEIIIPKTVKFLGIGVFRECNKLGKVVIQGAKTYTWDDPSKDLTTVFKAGLFKDCTNLKQVELGAGVKSLHDINPFKGCTSLTDIILSNDYTEHYLSTFDGCPDAMVHYKDKSVPAKDFLNAFKHSDSKRDKNGDTFYTML